MLRETSLVGDGGSHTRRASSSWASWLVGTAIFGAVVIATLQVSDASELVALIGRVDVRWVLVAGVCQAITYLSESQVWRGVTRAAGAQLPLSTAYQLSISKLFVDQAVPSGGLSGTLIYVEGLRRSGVARRIAISGVVVDTFSYYFAYALCVAVALVIAVAQEHINAPVAAVAVLFAIVSTVFAVAVLMQFGLKATRPRGVLGRYRLLTRMLSLMRDVDPRLARDPHVLARAIGWQASIQILDAATVWLLLLALGATVEPGVVFASYMFSALFRTVSVSPGGLGTFEAASVMILRSAGVPIETAFAATVLFRVLNFWLPMIPGVWCARRVVRSRGPFSGSGAPSPPQEPLAGDMRPPRGAS